MRTFPEICPFSNDSYRFYEHTIKSSNKTDKNPTKNVQCGCIKNMISLKLHSYRSASINIQHDVLTRAPLGYFYNAPHWGGGGYFEPPLISETTGPILKIQAAFESPGKTVDVKTNFIDLGVTSDVTGQVKVKMFDISGLVTSASKIAMLSTNKAN